MFTAHVRRGFTLLEVVLAVAIMAMVALSIYPFIQLNLVAIKRSTEFSREDSAMHGLIAAIQTQLVALPAGRQGALLGEAHQFNDVPSDEMQWICGPGNGLFTKNASGEYKTTLALHAPEKKGEVSELGLRRVSLTNQDAATNWLPLMSPVTALEIRYFDPRLNSWLQKWTDQQARPALVRLRIWRDTGADPFEAVLALPLSNTRT
ncbi:MAG: prepilin-type N-terminal cleavage/methylation domain-containing protein [Verrucomicrobiota bacterium]|nr:prepilin-type N-terminal cleavage/methylation domain-containing protein [Verrucomicrobiota bacterium]